ncbi:cell division protein ZapA [Mesocricetibacter intestinalis]|uniref:Cell division protein ZapA n=1 Tax=Mesocricetibacter intestinalis TaxID=1521930 RepID=A0A4R6VCT5_9PAST|nr:cell division protein ZapA [Mesocricetibacter intestinalis]TDQ58103.1 cell division protein ZapA [Mesocricetibacter intestinalis]
MSSKTIELNFLGQLFRLNCPEEQHEALREAAKILDQRVSEMKERTGILQVERVLAIVALNFSFELMKEQQKTQFTEGVLQSQIQQLTHSLESISLSGTISQQTTYEIQ